MVREITSGEMPTTKMEKAVPKTEKIVPISKDEVSHPPAKHIKKAVPPVTKKHEKKPVV